ncbi:MAG: methionyl-tRNA formyltransferase, partial [Oscillospiraceae bacterium]|nr:methionyl-tRNA formyltransferase [Oscillospiraceae bacterium]
MKILFMGTPEFAKASLECLIKNNCDLIGVITQPDKPAGRKMVLTPPPVKELALASNIPVYQPQSAKSGEFLELLKTLNPDIIAVVAYGQILPKSVLDYPAYGCVNVHASLLPKYRGSSPIVAAIAAGEKTTGITTIFMDEGIDTGDMILQESIEIGENETHGELHDRLANLGGELLFSTLVHIQNGTAKRQKQPGEGALYTKKIDEKLCEIDWGKTAREIHDKIRSLSPSPAAFARLDGKKLKIYKSEIIQPGEKKSTLDVLCEGGVVRILEVQPEGSKKMSAKDFLN